MEGCFAPFPQRQKRKGGTGASSFSFRPSRECEREITPCWRAETCKALSFLFLFFKFRGDTSAGAGRRPHLRQARLFFFSFPPFLSSILSFSLIVGLGREDRGARPPFSFLSALRSDASEVEPGDLFFSVKSG